MEQVNYGTKSILFHLKKANRKTLGIEVHPDLSIWAIAPQKTSVEDVKKIILKRASWILKQQRYFEQFLPRTPEREYVSGETHLYLGRRYILRIRKGLEDIVKLKGGELIVYYTKDKSMANIKHLLTSWYYNHAKRKFDLEFKNSLLKFKIYKIGKPAIEIRRMKKRWGSCTPKGKIILNPELIKTSRICIEYVVIHELCHLVEPNHGKKFYDLLEKIYPAWKTTKMRLESFMV